MQHDLEITKGKIISENNCHDDETGSEGKWRLIIMQIRSSKANQRRKYI